MKSQSGNLLRTVDGLLKDVRRAYPTLKGLSRDLKRLSLLVKDRGLGVFTLDLPARESELIAGLKTGSLRSSGFLRYSKKYPVPRLYAGLYMLIFDENLCLRSDADVNAIAFLRQLLVIGKKIEVPCSQKREQLAIKEYINVEQQMVGPNLNWESDCLDSHGVGASLHLCDDLGLDLPLYPEYNFGRTAGDKLLLQRCQRLADIVAREFGPFCPDCFIEARRAENGTRLGLRHGPGAVAEKAGCYYDKFQFTSWSNKLEALYPWETTGKMPLDPRLRPKNHEVPARLITVPKTAKGPRIIAAEPSEHMFTQNLFADWLIEKIDSTILSRFIDFKDQGKSGRLVLQSSLDGKLSTIDLSSASDRLSLYVIERVFRLNPSMLRAIHATRTRWLRLPNGECIKLKKFASQGTALTFPVQTLVFFLIAASASAEKVTTIEDLRALIGKVRVFGDDIIVPTDGYAKTVKLLHLLGLKVNEEKSFVSGHFRESCGTDAFKGYDITPCKPKTTVSGNPESIQAVVDTINNLFCKGYWNASKQLEHRQPARSFYFNLVGVDSGASGLVSPSFGLSINRIIRDASCTDKRRGSDGQLCDAETAFWRSVHDRLSVEIPNSVRGRVRFNSRNSRPECRRRGITSLSARGTLTDGYSGLLFGQLCPYDPETPIHGGSRSRVPERPRLVMSSRWVDLSLCGNRAGRL